MKRGASIIFNVAFKNEDGTTVPHTNFSEVIVYVYTYEDKPIKFSKTSKYSQMAVIDENTLQVRMTSVQTSLLAKGVAKYSVYAAIDSNDMPDGKVSYIGGGSLLVMENDPISIEA